MTSNLSVIKTTFDWGCGDGAVGSASELYCLVIGAVQCGFEINSKISVGEKFI